MTVSNPRCCIIIPVYRHAKPVINVLNQLSSYGLPCILADDGNDIPLTETLAGDLHKWPWAEVLRLPIHRGKGAACMEGCRRAQARGFTHVLFVDADGQHDVTDIPHILALSREHPEAMILGKPVFDQSAPFKRRFGRIVSNLWVWIETLSFTIKDSLCGFRCIPLGPLLKIDKKTLLARGIVFDPDIVVRLFWEGVTALNFDTHIRYPESGVSNFRLGRDNAILFLLHTRLFFGMLARSPALVWRHWSRRP